MWRNEQPSGDHLDPQLLAARAAGALPADAVARVEGHLVDCVLCRLEAARAARFLELETDEAAASEADWPAAESRLRAAWPSTPASAATRRRRAPVGWLLPAAAAAALVLVAVTAGDQLWRATPQEDSDGMRGTAVIAPVIQPLSPIGELEAAPERFTWSATREFDAFALEVFTDDLDPVVRLKDVMETHADLPDSLRERLLPGTTYFWHVEAWEGLTVAEASPTVSFRVSPAGE